ncbi:DUF6701 domain-containing protein [Vibrio sinus]
MISRLIIALLFLLASQKLIAAAIYPLADGVCVATAAQTWENSNAQVWLSTQDAILGVSDRKIGFHQTSNEENVNKSCGSAKCIFMQSLRLEDEPDFSISGVTFDNVYNKQELSGSQTLTLSNGTFRIKEILKLDDNSTLRIVGAVTLYVEKMEVLSSATIDVDSDNPDDFIIVSRNGSDNDSEVILKGDSAFVGHWFVEDYIELSEDVQITGTITTKDLIIKDNATLISDVPESCSSTPTDFSSLNLCDYIPEPAQAWKTGSSLNMNNSSSSITGWSQSYLDSNLSGSDLTVAFDSVSYHAGLAGACGSTYKCVSGGTEVSTPPSLAPGFTSTTSLSIDQWNYTSTCVSPNCSYSVSGNVITLNILQSLQSLTVNAYGSEDFIVNFTDLGEANGYGTKIQTYSSGGDVESKFAANGNYTFGTMSFNGGTISVKQNVQIFVVTSFTQSNAVTLNDVDSTKDLIMYGPDATFSFSTNTGDFGAQILADTLTLNNQINIVGAVTANTFTTSVANTNIDGQGACLNPANSSFGLTISPSIDIALSCESQTITLQVVDSGGSNTGSYTGNIHASVTAGSLSVTTGTFVSGNSYKPDSNGTLVLSLDGEGTGDITLTSYLEDDQANTTLTGSYKFVPYRFDISTNPTSVIAGKPAQVTVTPLECQSVGGSETAVTSNDYVGNTTLTTTATSYSQPSSPTNSAVINIKDDASSSYTEVSNDVTLNFALNSGSVEAQMDVLYSEAGVVTYTLSNTECVSLSGGGQDCKTYTGSHQINARPWTFAICSNDTISGTASSGSGYKSAGSTFAVMVKPIVWVSNGSESADIDTTSLCSTTVTQNFFDSGAPSATVSLTHDIDTPSGGNAGTLSGTTSMLNTNKSSSGDYYDFSGLSWNEVGSIKLQADTAANYLSMNVNRGYRGVGRFYPAYFKVNDTTWTYPGSQTFIYMGQPFDGMQFQVEALNSSEGAVQNYVNFDSSLRAGFDLIEDPTRFVSPAFSAGSWALVSSTRSIGTFTNTVGSDCTDSICWNKKSDYSADGPYNSSENIATTNIEITSQSGNTDPVAYTSDGEDLTVQPDIRFGRINLSDVGGVQGDTLTVPLAAEYWNGSNFITNTDDSSTSFNASNFCQENIWSSQTNNGSLTGSGTVSSGESRSIKASQTVSDREQIKFWLTLSSARMTSSCGGTTNNLSWLQYDWVSSSSGEEDPYSIITFGIHRGNDKVLFRGEPGLTSP